MSESMPEVLDPGDEVVEDIPETGPAETEGTEGAPRGVLEVIA